MAQEGGPQLSQAGLGGFWGWGCLWVLPGGVYGAGGGEREAPLKDVPCVFTVNHHCSEQALLLAAQPVVRLALLVTEAGQALGTGQVLTDRVLHTGAQAVRASRSWARRKRRAHVNQTGRRNSRGAHGWLLFPGGEGACRVSKATPPLLFHTISQQSQPHNDGMLSKP